MITAPQNCTPLSHFPRISHVRFHLKCKINISFCEKGILQMKLLDTERWVGDLPQRTSWLEAKWEMGSKLTNYFLFNLTYFSSLRMENNLIKGRWKHQRGSGISEALHQMCCFSRTFLSLQEGGHIPRPKPVSQQLLLQAVSVRPCPVENQNSFCLSYVPVNYSKLILTLACLQNYFVWSLFLVVKSESLRWKHDTKARAVSL